MVAAGWTFDEMLANFAIIYWRYGLWSLSVSQVLDWLRVAKDRSEYFRAQDSSC